MDEGLPSFCLCLCFFVYIFRGRKEGVDHLLNESWLRLEGVVSLFFSGESVGRKHRNWFWCMPFIC